MHGGHSTPMAPTAQSLAEELLAEPRQKINNLPKLLGSLAQPSDTAVPIIRCLQDFFLGCFERGELSSRQPAISQQQKQSPEAVFDSWLRRQYTVYLSALLALLVAPAADAKTQLAALAAVMECVRGEEAGVFNNELYGRVLEAAVRGKAVRPDVLGALLGKYLGYADVRYYTLRSIVRLAERHAAAGPSGAAAGGDVASDEEDEAGAGAFVSPHDMARTLHDVLASTAFFEAPAGEMELSSWCGAAEVGVVVAASDADGSRQRKRRRQQEQEESGAGAAAAVQRAKWASPKLQKKAYSDAWLAFLRLDLPEDTYKRVLARLHDLVVPAIFNPLLLSDFLTHSLDKGGLIGMLALNGIFILVTQYGLEYPNFYARLYALLDEDALQAKYRARFFQLADVFLASSMVPAYTAASFAKKFARLALTASPAGSLVCLAFIHNIIRRHPACLQMLHRPQRQASGGEGTAGSEGLLPVFIGEDIFDPSEPDPAHTRAIESSLWELEALRAHSSPMVAAFCGSLDKDLSDKRKTAELDIVDLLPSSYASMFNTEAERRIKGVPTAFYQRPPAKLFDANCVADFPAWA